MNWAVHTSQSYNFRLHADSGTSQCIGGREGFGCFFSVPILGIRYIVIMVRNVWRFGRWGGVCFCFIFFLNEAHFCCKEWNHTIHSALIMPYEGIMPSETPVWSVHLFWALLCLVKCIQLSEYKDHYFYSRYFLRCLSMAPFTSEPECLRRVKNME